ncbi:MAG: endolytic transglycosylase MltG [Austwickia sp.]|nr:endolytic transglycosylase MltG [Austwickia sp.]
MSNRLDDSIFGTTSPPSDPGSHPPRAAATRSSRHARAGRAEAGDGAQRRTGAGGRPGGRSGGSGGGRGSRGPRWIVMALVTLLVIGGGGSFALTQLRPVLDSVFGAKDYEGQGTGSVRFVVKPGESGRQIADNLVAAGVVKSDGAFESALEETPGPQIQPGTYALRSGMSASAALGQLRSTTARQVIKVTVPEGTRATQIYALLAKASGRPVAEYQKAAANPRALGLPAHARGAVEGYLFPATYSFNPGEGAAGQLAIMVARMRAELDELKVPAADQRRVLIMASLVEMEARLAADRPKVARVLLNRLDRGMALQLDSTVKYLNPTDGLVTTTDAQRAAKNGYNTYAMKGLPVGPIANPGRASLEAVLRPAAGPWLFFVTVNPTTGVTRFATTLTEHETNVRAFQAWCRVNSGKC